MPIMPYDLRQAMEKQGFKVKSLSKNQHYEVGKMYWCGYWGKSYTVLSVECNYGLPYVTVRWQDGKINSHGTPLDSRMDYEIIM